MKTKIKIFLLFAFLLSAYKNIAAQGVDFTIKYSMIGTNPGYDHLTKMIVYIDGEEAGESDPDYQTKDNSVTVKFPSGEHDITAILYAYQNGYWEERTVQNNYSFNCIYTNTLKVNYKSSINILFDFANKYMQASEPSY